MAKGVTDSPSASIVPSIDDYFEHNVWESCVGIAFPRAGQLHFRVLFRGNRPGQDRTFLSLCSGFTVLQEEVLASAR